MCPRSKIQEFRYYWIKYEATTYLQNCAAGLENESLCEGCSMKDVFLKAREKELSHTLIIEQMKGGLFSSCFPPIS